MANLGPLPPLLLLDGGLGTTLADQHSVVFDDSTPLWSSHMLLSDSGLEMLSRVQSDFARNGAHVILSATYQASFEGFERSGVEGKGESGRRMRGAVRVASAAFDSVGSEGMENGDGGGEKGGMKEQRRGRGKVALGLGAYGATMLPGQEYSGKYDAEHSSVKQLRDWHLERIEAFFPRSTDPEDEREEREKCWESIDLVAFETLPRVDEILAVREVMGSLPSTDGAKEGDKDRDFWISSVFPGEENVLPDGSSIAEVVEAMLGTRQGTRRPWGVGINCTKVGKVEGLLEEFERAVGGLFASEGEGEGSRGWPALVLYPDGTNGEVYNTSTKVWEKKSAGDGSEMSWDETIYGIVQRARERRLWSSVLVGGCCKVTPGDIGRLRVRIDAGEEK